MTKPDQFRRSICGMEDKAVMTERCEISIVMPFLNEEKTMTLCIKKAFNALRRMNIPGEVLVADNGSSDRSIDVALSLGARVERVNKRGYGAALMGGAKAAKGKYIIMADADDSYDLEEAAVFYNKLKEGYDFVIGNRFKGKIEQGAMPFSHRYLGTPVLTFLVNLLFKADIRDINCGMRGFTKKAFERMHLRAEGMEFASEMIIKASLVGLKIAEVPCNLYKDKRNGPPHLRTWHDGWRHLRFMLLFSTTWVFMIPGAILAIAGFLGMSALFLRDIFNLEAAIFITDKHMLSFMMVFLTGCQIVQFGIIAKAFSFSKRFDYKSKTMKFLYRNFTLEKGILLGGALIFSSLIIFSYLYISYYGHLLPKLSDSIRLDMAIFSIAFCLLGISTIFSSFVMGLFYLKVK